MVCFLRELDHSHETNWAFRMFREESIGANTRNSILNTFVASSHQKESSLNSSRKLGSKNRSLVRAALRILVLLAHPGREAFRKRALR